MTNIRTWQKPALPFDRWVRNDMRLESTRDLAQILTDIVNYAEYGAIPDEEPDADLLSPPVELVWMLRQAADWIQAWTGPDHTL